MVSRGPRTDGLCWWEGPRAGSAGGASAGGASPRSHAPRLCQGSTEPHRPSSPGPHLSCRGGAALDADAAQRLAQLLGWAAPCGRCGSASRAAWRATRLPRRNARLLRCSRVLQLRDLHSQTAALKKGWRPGRAMLSASTLTWRWRQRVCGLALVGTHWARPLAAHWLRGSCDGCLQCSLVVIFCLGFPRSSKRGFLNSERRRRRQCQCCGRGGESSGGKRRARLVFTQPHTISWEPKECRKSPRCRDARCPIAGHGVCSPCIPCSLESDILLTQWVGGGREGEADCHWETGRSCSHLQHRPAPQVMRQTRVKTPSRARICDCASCQARNGRSRAQQAFSASFCHEPDHRYNFIGNCVLLPDSPDRRKPLYTKQQSSEKSVSHGLCGAPALYHFP